MTGIRAVRSSEGHHFEFERRGGRVAVMFTPADATEAIDEPIAHLDLDLAVWFARCLFAVATDTQPKEG